MKNFTFAQIESFLRSKEAKSSVLDRAHFYETCDRKHLVVDWSDDTATHVDWQGVTYFVVNNSADLLVMCILEDLLHGYEDSNIDFPFIFPS